MVIKSMATAGSDIIFGTAKGDGLNGLAGDDVFFAGSGDDTILGNGVEGSFGEALSGPGNNVIFAGSGDDIVTAGNQNDSVFGGAGNDIISGAGAFANSGGSGNVVLARDQGDFIDGGAGDDRINGQGGDDTIIGGSGKDTIFGSLGRDILTGGSGRDLFQFQFNAAPGVFESDTGSGTEGRDVITDFRQNQDKIDLSSYALQFGQTGSDVFIGNDDFLQADQFQVRVYAEAGSTIIQFNVPFAVGFSSVYEIELAGHVRLLESDFIF